MKLVNFRKAGANALGVVAERGIADVSAFAGPGTPVTMAQALAMGRESAVAALSEAVREADAFLSPDQIAYAPASDAPEKILCVGKNYAAHAAEVPELFKAPPGSPEIFAKFRNTLVPHGGRVRLNPASKKHDYEAEIAVVIGRRCAYVAPEEAESYIFGYTLANDISARDLQKAASQWTPGKTCDTFCPLGPWILTADEVSWDDLHIEGYKNGELRQSGCSRDMIWTVPVIVSFLSRCCTLRPGDVILTGTPSGVILGRPEGQQDWLRDGDTLRVASPELGTLDVRVTD